jgi:hypothetical protein
MIAREIKDPRDIAAEKDVIQLVKVTFPFFGLSGELVQVGPR